MAQRYIGTAATGPQINLNIVAAASGGTLAGGQVVQLIYDDTVFTNTTEGKQRLMAAVKAIVGRLQTAKSWPLDTTS